MMEDSYNLKINLIFSSNQEYVLIKKTDFSN